LAEDGTGPRTKLARFYIKSLLPEYHSLLSQSRQGAHDLYAITAGELLAL